MKLIREVVFLGAATLLTTAAARADEPKVLTNHVGYETSGPKHAVVLGSASDNFTTCALKDNRDSRTLLTVPAQHTGPVKKWREWHFWTVDFDSREIPRSVPFPLRYAACFLNSPLSRT